MSATLSLSISDPLVLSISNPVEVHFDGSKFQMNDDEYFQFCQLNRDLRIERNSEGDIIVMAPTGGKGGIQNAKLILAFGKWAELDRSGTFFDSSTEFILPNRAGRAPDLSWVRNERWDSLSEKEQEQFPPLCPDFVLELRSKTDRLNTLQAKMEEYIANGAQLGWLIDPLERKVHIYRPAAEPEVLDNPEQVSGEPLLKGFVLDVRSIWD
jgi:Uma2 family endonuclease